MKKIMATAFAAAMATGSSTLPAMTQEEALRAIRQQVSDGGGNSGMEAGAYAWMALVALALSILLLVMRWRRGQRAQASRTPRLHDANKLIKELRRQSVLTRQDIRQLKREAAQVEKTRGVKVGSPLVMVLCPSLKGK